MDNQEKNVATWEEVYETLNNIENKKSNGSNCIVFSILSLVLCVVPFIAIPFSIVGFVKAIKNLKCNNKKVKGVFSIILSVIGFFVSCFMLLIWLKFGLALVNQFIK